MEFRKATILILTALSFFGATSIAAQDEAMYIAPSGNVGLGLNSPERQLHMSGSNATFRMDRTENAAAFIIVRTTTEGLPLKTFVVGTIASDFDDGEFIINDLGTAVGGPGVRRMTIENDGTVDFSGEVFAAAFTPTSSIRYKDNVEQITDPLALTEQLQGVRFDWKESGKSSLGFIAEDVESVLPEVVSHDAENGEVRGMNYDAIVPILVEAIKAQQRQIEASARQQKVELAALKEQVAEFQALKARLIELEALVDGGQQRNILARN